MPWQSDTINPATTSPAGDITKLTNDLAVLRSVLGGGADAAVPNVFNGQDRADVASAGTVSLSAAGTNYVRVTGTTTITAITLGNGDPRFVVFDNALTLTHGASLILPGAANITTAAGDCALFVGEASGVVRCVAYQRANGQPVSLVAANQIRPISASVSANALTISASSLTLDFRSTTLGSGTVTTVTGTPSNLVVPSGATLGTINATQSDLVVLALNNAGTIELAVVNIAGGNDLSEMGVISTTAISAGATSAGTVYSTTARSNVAYRVVGLVRSTQTTAGTWASAPSLIQGQGGQALSAMYSLGFGQTWQNVSGSRSLGTSYYNTTGRPIQVSVVMTASANVFDSYVSVAGFITSRHQLNTANAAGTFHTHTFIVPPGVSYLVANQSNASVSVWMELR